DRETTSSGDTDYSTRENPPPRPETAGENEAGSEETVEPPQSAGDTSESLGATHSGRVETLERVVEDETLGPGDLESLVALLDSDDQTIRREAADALGTLGTTHPEIADEALRALRGSRLDSAVEVSQAASDAIERIEQSR
ncbi:MAG: hypothetical protein ABEI99_11385, partial [Halobaculum sp.]